jgi:hypothetical protein
MVLSITNKVVLVMRKYQRNWPCRHRWESNIKIDLTETDMDLFQLAKDRVQ